RRRPAARRAASRRAGRAAAPAARAAAGTLHRRHLPPGDRAAEPLCRGRAAWPVRRLCLVRSHFGRDAAPHRATPRRPGDLSVRALTPTEEDFMKVSEIMTRD